MDGILEQLRFLRPGWTDVIEILIVAFLLYRVLLVLQRTRAMQIMLGVVLLAFGAQLLLAARKQKIDTREAAAITTMDLLWVVASAALLIVGGPLTVAGKWAVAMVADVVLLFAILQIVGLRRLGRDARNG